MANAARLAIAFIETKPTIADNITVVLKDTGATPAGATQAASQAVQEGASLILGPLRADQVTAAGAVAQAAGIPVIGFSNNSGAASPGVYLLNVLPESEVKRSMGYVKALGKKAFAGDLPQHRFRPHPGGRVPRRRPPTSGSMPARSTISPPKPKRARSSSSWCRCCRPGRSMRCSSPTARRRRASACCSRRRASPPGKVQIIGSADWNGDPAIRQHALPARARSSRRSTMPATRRWLPEYQAKFGAHAACAVDHRLHRDDPRQCLVAGAWARRNTTARS